MTFMSRVERDDSSLVPAYIEKSIRQVTLELMCFGTVCRVCKEIHQAPADFLQHLKAYIVPSWSKDMVDIAAKWYCPAEMKREIRFPADWWSAVKERFFPAWAKNRWPPSWRVIKIYEMYPEVTWPLHSGHKRNVFIREDSDAIG